MKFSTKKILFTFVALLLLFSFNPKTAYALPVCRFEPISDADVSGNPGAAKFDYKFCVYGIDDDTYKDAQLKISCSNSCRDANAFLGLAPHPGQQYDFDTQNGRTLSLFETTKVESGIPLGTKHTCTAAQFNADEFIAHVQSNMSTFVNACNVGMTVVPALIPGGLGAKVILGGLGQKLNSDQQICLNDAVANGQNALTYNLAPLLNHQVIKADGTVFCESELRFSGVNFVIEGEGLDGQDLDKINTGISQKLAFEDICRFAGAGAQKETCQSCIDAQKGIWTAFGCIPANPQQLVEKLLKIAIGVAGGIAFLMMIYAGFQMMISAGNPEKLNGAREIFMSAIAGLLLIIFSVVILNIIGVDILALPGFGK